MIWARRLKIGRDDSVWALPLADLLMLLLVLFVLIVSMSDPRPGGFVQAGQSVRSALGYSPKPGVSAGAGAMPAPDRPAVDTVESLQIRLTGAADEPLPPCAVIRTVDRVVIRVQADVAFIGPTAVLSAPTRKLVARVADLLREGQARLEVRAYGPQGAVPPGLPYRDRMDIACERVRAVRLLLTQAGVAEDRLTSSASEEPAGGTGFEVVMFAGPPPGDGGAAESVVDDG